jgi:hypothetical protein
MNEQQLQHATDEKVFKYKLDFFYQQAIVYLVTLLLYAGIRGTFTLEQMPPMSVDPILYIIIVFVLISFIGLGLNKIRDRKLIIKKDQLVFHQKFHERVIPVRDIEWIYIGRERSVQTAGRSQAVIFKIKDRQRLFRIRVGRYERENELLGEMQRIAELVPKAKRPLFGMRMIKLV